MNKFLILLVVLLPQNALAQSSAWKALKPLAAPAVAVGVNLLTDTTLAKGAVEHLNYLMDNIGSAGTPEADFSEGMKQWRAGNRDEALRHLRLAAKREYSPAQVFLGDLALSENNYAEARDYYVKADLHDASWAAYQLGTMAYHGHLGGGVDYQTALKWYRRAAARHESRAEVMVAAILLNQYTHTGAPSSAEATELANDLADAAKQFNPDSYTNLGYVYMTGTGRPANLCAAWQWTSRAAEYRNPVAISNLGDMREQGITGSGECNVPADRIAALKHYREAARLGYQPAVAEAERLEAALKREMAELMASARLATATGLCFPNDSIAVYDADLNQTGVRSNGLLSTGLDVWATGEDFVMISVPDPVHPAQFVQKSKITFGLASLVAGRLSY